MPGRHDEAQAASETGLFSCCDFLNVGAVFLDAACKGVEIGVARNLEPRVIHARHICSAKNNAVAVKLLPGAQVDPALGLSADLAPTDAINIMRERPIQIRHAGLNVAGSQHTL